MSTRILIEHLARVEGHGGVFVELDGDRVARVELSIFEGLRLLEGLLRGRSYEDVAPIVSRICAICSVAHTVTSLSATERAFGVTPSPQTELLRDLLFRGENIESHALHIFLLALPDYVGAPAATAVPEQWQASVALGLQLKKLGNLIQQTVGGRAIHPVNAVLGGFGALPTIDQLLSLRDALVQGAADAQAALDALCSLPDVGGCEADRQVAALIPPGPYGYYGGGEIAIAGNGTQQRVPADEYRALAAERSVPHSHAKHSLFGGEPFMVGALARLTINRERLTPAAAAAAQRLALKLPSRNPLDNNKAQAVELVLDIDHATRTVERLLESELRPEPPPTVHPRAASGTAVSEAPRGLLAHSYSYDDHGRIVAADVVTPTALNAASVERDLRRAVEQHPTEDLDGLRRQLEIIVRAYDPCISCSVHVVQKRHAV